MEVRRPGQSQGLVCLRPLEETPRAGSMTQYLLKQEVITTVGVALRANMGSTVTQLLICNVLSVVEQLHAITPMAFATNPGVQQDMHGAAGDLPQGTTGFVGRHADGVELGPLELHTSYLASGPDEPEGQGTATIRHFIGSEAGDECLERNSEGVLNSRDLREACATWPETETHEAADVLPRRTIGQVDRQVGTDTNSEDGEYDGTLNDDGTGEWTYNEDGVEIGPMRSF